jgi:prolyl oligopeptidase
MMVRGVSLLHDTEKRQRRSLPIRYIGAAVLMLLAARDASGGAGSQSLPAPLRPSHHDYFGTNVVDGYGWMDEQSNSSELRTWLTAQDQRARAVLDSLPKAKQLRSRVEQLSTATAEIKRVARTGNRWFYLKRPADANSFILYAREGLHGSERVLIDPDSLGSDGKHRAIDFFEPSRDGRLVVYGISTGGSEDSVLHVVDVEHARVLDDSIDRARIANPQWRQDGKSFFYRRLQESPSNAPASAIYEKARTWLHVVGTAPKDDREIFGFGVSDRIALEPQDFASVYCLGKGRYLLATVRHGLQQDVEVYVAPAAAVGGDIPWRKLASFEDLVTRFDVHGDDIYLLSRRNAPRANVIRASLADGDISHGQVVLAPSDLVLHEVSVARDALYVRASDGGLARLIRIPFGRGKKSAVPLPFDGSMSLLWTAEETPGAIFLMQSWVRPPSIYQYAPGAPSSDTGLLTATTVATSDFEAEEVKVPSSGGVQVPLSIVRRRGLPLDGRAATWLSVYGSHGYVYDARFEPRRIAWLELGGIYAVCHPRGGGEYGEDWHQAGMKQRKQNTIDDVLACAHHLIERGYTSPAHLAIEGTSAGGLAAGGALTQHPELFGAAILRMPVVDPIAFEQSAGGESNARELGSAKIRDEFNALLAISPYHAVRDGVSYPAVLLLTALNDRRVPPSQAAKMAARLEAATASGKPILLRVDGDAGHAGIGSTRAQIDAELADIYAFLASQLGANASSPPTD